MGTLRSRILVVFVGLLASCARVEAPADLGPGGDGGARIFDMAGVDLLQPEGDLALCASCDDQIACTLDTCVATGTCAHVPDHGKCPDRQLCTKAGCVAVESTKICSACSSNSDCGLDEACVSLSQADLGATSLCVPSCGLGGACPKGYACDSNDHCLPTSASGRCCYDGDSDEHGLGAGCLGTDCDDSDPAVYEGHAEICDGKDNDCNGTKDEGFLCGGPACNATGTSYAGTSAGLCSNGACTTPMTSSCGLYSCQPVTTPVEGNACRTACGGSDTSCVGAAYCDVAGCAPQKPAGGICTRDRMCAGGHCQNGFCCASGDCCAATTDCAAATYSSPAACDAPATSCQGHRQDRACTANKCVSTRVDDDSACSPSISISCDPLQPRTCTGSATQTALACATTCSSDGDCVSTAYCSGGTCMAKKPDGSTCTADDQCPSGHHCLGGFCCNATTGSCCGVASDCSAAFASAATCDSPLTSCQGHRVDRACVQSVCASQNVDDDTACSSSVSKTCGAYSSVACKGTSTQTPLACSTTCTSDGDCAGPTNKCKNGTCQPVVGNGGACTTSAQCGSGFCVSNVCCSSACNGTTCDTCGGGSCAPFSDPYENGNTCLDSLPDLGSGAFTKSVQAYLQSTTDTEDWYQFYASDASNACNGTIRVQLTVPSGADYDVYLYFSADGSCTTPKLLTAGLSTTGNEDVTWNEQCSVSDEGWYFVRVKRYSGSSCTTPYTLTVTAGL